MTAGRVYIGTSGYQYNHWRGRLYPTGLPKRRWFARYTERFDTVELNNTFYRLPQAGTFDQWRAAAPAGFRYALKLNRFCTHLMKLGGGSGGWRRFIRRADRLGEHLGPVLIQLPPYWRADPPRLDRFLSLAARHHRCAVEFREPSWLCSRVFRVLERHGAALCIHDRLPSHPWRLTADWLYLRYHGAGALYAGRYPTGQLQKEAERIRAELDCGREVWAYFNNDLGGHAVVNAEELRAYVERVED